jgi:hypothetical protein
VPLKQKKAESKRRLGLKSIYKVRRLEWVCAGAHSAPKDLLEPQDLLQSQDLLEPQNLQDLYHPQFNPFIKEKLSWLPLLA